jgi:hypothetical protein
LTVGRQRATLAFVEPVIIVGIACLLFASGVIDLELVRSGQVSRRTGAKFMAARPPLTIGLLGLALGASPLVAIILTVVVGMGAALAYRLVMSSI